MTEIQKLQRQVEILEDVVEFLGDVIVESLPHTRSAVYSAGQGWENALNLLEKEYNESNN